MAMNYAWQERKKFAIPVAAGAAVILIWYLFVLSGINNATDRAVRDRKSLEQQLRLRMQAGVPTDEAVGRAERDKGTFLKDLKDIQEKLAFRVEEKFRTRDGESSARKFGQLRHEIATRIDALRTQKGINDPIDMQLKFPREFGAIPEPVMAEWLIRLAVVQRVCVLSLENNVTKLTLVETADENQADPLVPPDRFLGVLTVKFKVEGAAESILRIAHGLQMEGPNFLALQGVEVTSANPTTNTLAATLTVAALVVRPEGALVTEAKP
jgi:hypothetical protein